MGFFLVEEDGFHTQRVARVDRLGPAQLVDAGRAESAFEVASHVFDNHAHKHGACVRAGCAELAEQRLCGGFVGEVERLRAVFRVEFEGLLLGDVVVAETLGGTDFENPEII